ncbi:MAG: NADH:flavin oxidoreductase, partial [Bacillota bacterium]|nr:NADH:flavin oxidoreductase [Bacillota bacterium]
MSNLLKPLNTKNISLINRLIMPPMATSKSEEDGRISKEILEYYNEKSHGGYISLIIIEHSYVMEQGKASNNQLSIADDKFVDDLKKLSEVIHKNGSKAIMQINHAGSSTSKEITGYDLFSASDLPNPRRNKEIKPLKLT